MKKEFKQRIIGWKDNQRLLVESQTGTIYPVIVSDHARANPLFDTVEEGDMAIIHRVHTKYYLYDIQKNIQKKEDDSYLSEVPLDDMGYDYD